MIDEDKLDLQPETDESSETDESLELGSSDPLEGDEDAQNALIALYAQCKSDDRYPRVVEVKDVKQEEFYWGGRQYIWWSTQDQKWNLPTQQVSGDIDVEDMPRFEFVTNIYQARGLMMIAAVAGAPPRIRFFPNDADDQADLETSEARTKLAKLIERWNPPQKLLQEETYHAWTGGFIAWWSRFIPNGEKYGVDQFQTMKQGQQDVDKSILCPQCGWSAPADQAVPPVPCPQCGAMLSEENITEEEPIPTLEDGDDQEIAKGRQVISVYGALNCSRPMHTNHQSQWHYFGLEEEFHYAILRAEFEDKADKIRPGASQGPDDIFERNARLAVAENTRLVSQSGASTQKLCTLVRAWFRPSAFWMIEDKSTRDKLKQTFPRGCRLEFTGTTFCKSVSESMDDAIVSCHAMPGRGQHRPSCGRSMVSIQDRVNTFSNIEAETYEYGIPITYRAADTFASDANEDQRAAPGLEIEVALGPSQIIQNRIMQVRADTTSPDMYKHNNELIGPIADQITGTYPAVTGAGADQGAPETVGQQAMQRDQAMGRMGIFYVNLKQAHADVMTISCRIFEQNTTGQVKIPTLGASGDFESEAVDISALEGDAEAYPEGDENFPELWNQQRATMMSIMDTPYGAELAKDPDNAELFSKMTGINGLKIPGRDAWQKQLKEISDLTKIPNGEEMLAGIAPQVEVDSDDFHEIESAACKWWMSSKKGQELKRQNPMGFMAVKQHKAEHDHAIPPPPPAEKPIGRNVTSNVKDMPPEAQAQWFEKELGIKVDPQAFIQQVAFEKAKKPATGLAGPTAPPKGESVNQPSGLGA